MTFVRQRLILLAASLLVATLHCHVRAFSTSSRLTKTRHYLTTCLQEKNNLNNDAPNLDLLKQELTQYLEKRREINADQASKPEVGKVIGGTKGNKILEYVSGAPNKAFVIEDEPEIFDYDQLTKYGYDVS